MSLRVIVPALAAVLALAACSEEPTETRRVRAPDTAERAASEAVNEAEQAVAPAETFTADELAGGVDAGMVAAPATTFSTATVKTTAGEALGEVHSVNVGPDDKAVSINVEVGGFLGVDEQVVTIDADRFTYLPDRNVLVASITKDEVASLAQVETEPTEEDTETR
jgi:hypothetical protein